MLAAAWVALLAVKLGLGYALKMAAHAYMRHYEQARARWAVQAQAAKAKGKARLS